MQNAVREFYCISQRDQYCCGKITLHFQAFSIRHLKVGPSACVAYVLPLNYSLHQAYPLGFCPEHAQYQVMCAKYSLLDHITSFTSLLGGLVYIRPPQPRHSQSNSPFIQESISAGLPQSIPLIDQAGTRKTSGPKWWSYLNIHPNSTWIEPI